MKGYSMKWKRVLIVIPCSLAGSLFSMLQNLKETGFGPGLAVNFKNGFSDAFFISLFIVLYTIILADGLLKKTLTRLNFTLKLIWNTLIYLIMFLLGRGLAISLTGRSSFALIHWEDGKFLQSLFFALGIILIITFIWQINAMLGQRILANFALGRYHKPRKESRFVMFIDLKDSTAITEKIGAEQFLHMMNRLFKDMTEPLLASGGEIYKYLGDEAIITWKENFRGGGPLQFFLDYNELLKDSQSYFQQRFSLIPHFKCGIDYGDIYIAEIGDIKQELAMVSDALNTASRIVGKAKDSELGLLCSHRAKERLDNQVTEWIDFGDSVLKGKIQTVKLWGVKYE